MIFEISVAQWVCRSEHEQCPDVDQNKHERCCVICENIIIITMYNVVYVDC